MTRVQDVMNTDVKTIAATAPAEEAWNVMEVSRIRHLIVIDEGQTVGVVSERDLAGPRGAAIRQGLQVGDLMTRDAVTVAPDTSVRKAANLMRGHSIGCLVVTGSHGVAGIVTVSDLLELIGRGIEHVAPAARRPVLARRAPRIAQNRPRANH